MQQHHQNQLDNVQQQLNLVQQQLNHVQQQQVCHKCIGMSPMNIVQPNRSIHNQQRIAPECQQQQFMNNQGKMNSLNSNNDQMFQNPNMINFQQQPNQVLPQILKPDMNQP